MTIRVTKMTKTATAKAAEQTANKSKMDRLNEAIADVFGEDLPDWKRQFLAIGVSLVAYCGTAAAIMPLFVMATAAVASTGMFISLFVYLLGAIVVMITAGTVAKFTYDFVLGFNYSNVEQRVAGWFNRGDKLATMH